MENVYAIARQHLVARDCLSRRRTYSRWFADWRLKTTIINSKGRGIPEFLKTPFLRRFRTCLIFRNRDVLASKLIKELHLENRFEVSYAHFEQFKQTDIPNMPQFLYQKTELRKNKLLIAIRYRNYAVCFDVSPTWCDDSK